MFIQVTGNERIIKIRFRNYRRDATKSVCEKSKTDLTSIGAHTKDLLNKT